MFKNVPTFQALLPGGIYLQLLVWHCVMETLGVITLREYLYVCHYVQSTLLLYGLTTVLEIKV